MILQLVHLLFALVEILVQLPDLFDFCLVEFCVVKFFDNDWILQPLNTVTIHQVSRLPICTFYICFILILKVLWKIFGQLNGLLVKHIHFMLDIVVVDVRFVLLNKLFEPVLIQVFVCLFDLQS